MFTILEDRTGHPADFWVRRSERHETWADAQTARELNLVDEVI
jgi:hypothetical protein